jgi:hypothetical protein
VHDLTITDFTSREQNHYPLSVMVVTGEELELHVEYDSAVFSAAAIDALADRLRRVLLSDDRRPNTAARHDGCADRC